MAIDYDTDLGYVRFLISDANEADLLLTDGQINAALTREGSVKLAAAQCLDSIASSEVLVSKVIRSQDLSTDGAKVSAELRARATELRRQVAEGEGEDTVGFDVVEFVNPFTRRYREATEPEWF